MRADRHAATPSASRGTADHTGRYVDEGLPDARIGGPLIDAAMTVP